MSTNTEVTNTGSSVPALYTPPALDIDASDIALPRIYVGQSNSKAVEAELVEKGQIYAGANAEDSDAVVLFDPKDRKAVGVLAHVLALTKARSATVDGKLQRFDLNDPDAPADSWVTYNYVVCLPEVDADVPYKLLLTKTQTPTAKKINTILMKGQARGPAHAIAFRLVSVARKNTKGLWFIIDAKPADSTEENVAAAAALAEMVGQAPPQPSAPVSAPAI